MWKGDILLKKGILAVEAVDKEDHEMPEVLWIPRNACLYLQHQQNNLEFSSHGISWTLWSFLKDTEISI